LRTALKHTQYIETDELCANLSFSVDPIPDDAFIDVHGIDALDHVKLQYKIAFPLNIVVNETVMTKYNELYHFLMKLKRVESVLQSIWMHFKHREVKIASTKNERIRALQMFRQEIQHFINIMQAYVMNQIHDICAKEFSTKLRTQAKTVEDLRVIHDEFLESILFGCMLSYKAKSILQVIKTIFALILRFRLQMVNNPLTQPLSDVAFESMIATRDEFRRQTNILYTELLKSSRKSTQIEHLLLRLNFNEYYEKATV